MRLLELFKDSGCAVHLPDCEVSDVVCDTRKLKPDCVFVCIKGANFDGHTAAEQALEAGAAAVVCARDLGLSRQIVTENTRLAYARLCANFFGNPASHMRMLGVTGTNGKTTVTKLIQDILKNAGLKVGLIGTIQNEIGDEVVHTDKTTPDAYALQSLLARMYAAGCDAVVMEVSSHALDQDRVGGMRFSIAAFTNLTQDHLDYHKDMESYFAAKKRLFSLCDRAVVNLDDPYGQRIVRECSGDFFTVSAERADADCTAKQVKCTAAGVQFLLTANGVTSKVQFAMPGFYSVHNALTAAAVCLQAGVCIDKIVGSLNASTGIRGRSELIPTGRDFTVLCDYAHSPDGLLNILPSVREYTEGRLITLFGCGGDRDRTKRPLMGAAAAENSDFLIVTSDNPRTEQPMAIIEDILPGVRQTDTPYVVIENRREAIFYAIRHAQAGDVIVLAGKGHEDYQVIGKEKIHFDEREIVADALRTL